jgi:protein involved in polysaccharide export with SLBB domain
MFGYSQTNEAIINQAAQAADAQNITTPAQAVQALEASGMTEAQARQLAAQRGLSYDQLLNDFFSDQNSENPEENPDSEDGEENEDSEEEEEKEEEEEEEEEEEDGGENKLAGARYFGYDIFNNNPYLDKEYLLGNIDEGYLIAPGDELRIITYGDNSFEQNVKVDRNGNINIRGYGLFFASGNSFKTLKSRLKIFLGKYLSGLTSNPQKTFMDVSLTQLRPVKVVVLGQVSAPGPHILNTSGSALSALYAAGGVKTSGTLREIKIYRNNKLYKTIDLYDYITKGQLKEDVRLTNNDIVFVDTRKNRFLLQGEVYNNAVFELKENEGLSELLTYSGGLPITAQTTKVNISRITPADKRTKDIIADRELITFNYQEARFSGNKVTLSDGDKITFFPILDMELNQVTISGHVVEPGMYSLKTYNNLKLLIMDAAKGVLPDVYMEKVDVTSIVNGITVNNSYNLNDILNSNISVPLNDMDQVQVYSNERVEGAKSVSISGYGVKATTTAWKENFSIYDLIFSNSEIDNPEFLTYLLKSRIDIKRYNNDTGDFNTLKFEFNNIDELKSTMLYPRDIVKLYSTSATENIDKRVGVFGYVKNPDLYFLEENMYIEDVLLLSGGFVRSANQEDLILNRPELDVSNERVVRKFNIKIDKDYLLGLKDKPDHGFLLKDRDILVVQQILGYQESIRISISGEVNFPQTVVAEFKNSTLRDVINYAGGLTLYANLEASSLIRDGKVITLDFENLNAEEIFENGDIINIASNKGIVSTTGAVRNESNFIWKKGLKAKKYIKNSGGKLFKDGGKSYVVLPNGKTKKIGWFKNPKVLPNSIIVTDFRPEGEDAKVRIQRLIDEITGTMTFIATTLTSVLIATKL